MQLVHAITEDRGNYTFVIYNYYSGDVKEVRVDADKIALYEDRSSLENLPQACPFLRFDRETGKAWCTVHLTRPDICRDYCCWRLLIRDAQGRRAGRVLYQRTFLPDTTELGGLWEEMKPTLNGLDDREWDKAVIRFLTAAGYRVRQ
ncbi:YkgJ family cysteine cluster protein [Methanogenium sp. S4BF]|uniref:YkgJ family cysteine cluster protein n=1 Tax=Methanogenium sp. S4BF TaxID=1789226 RepID=UPI002416D32B|nr:YkgJ family cysteine cluster protein [Methanogenium sp. S4BF]WFN34544.1 YkgJ family cysteine cluster protein [Methanogenium sp. S4BF]